MIIQPDDDKSRDQKTRHEMNTVEKDLEAHKTNDLSKARNTAINARQQPDKHTPTPRTPDPAREGNTIPEADYPVSPFGE